MKRFTIAMALAAILSTAVPIHASAASYVTICESGSTWGHTVVSVTEATAAAHATKGAKHVYDIIPPVPGLPDGQNWDDWGSAVLSGGCTNPARPSNDKPAGAIVISPGVAYTQNTFHAAWVGEGLVEGDNECAFTGQDDTPWVPMGRSIWYKLRTAADQTSLQVWVDGHWELGQVAQVYEKDATGALVPVGTCARGTGESSAAQITNVVQPSHRYWIQVGGLARDNWGNITTSVTLWR